MKLTKSRLCECGCGRPVAGRKGTRFAGATCRQRAKRSRDRHGKQKPTSRVERLTKQVATLKGRLEKAQELRRRWWAELAVLRSQVAELERRLDGGEYGGALGVLQAVDPGLDAIGVVRRLVREGLVSRDGHAKPKRPTDEA